MEVTPPNVNPNPKQRFQAYKPFVDAHREFISKPELQRATDFALLQMITDLTAADVDGNAAAARYHEIKGACDLVSRVRLLAEQTRIVKPVKSEREIDHNV